MPAERPGYSAAGALYWAARKVWAGGLPPRCPRCSSSLRPPRWRGASPQPFERGCRLACGGDSFKGFGLDLQYNHLCSPVWLTHEPRQQGWNTRASLSRMRSGSIPLQ